MNYFILFPNQLFEIKYFPFQDLIKNTKQCHFFLLEDPIYFMDKERLLSMNILKRIFHRSTMKWYENYLKDNNFNVHYCSFLDLNEKNYEFILKKMKKIDKIHWINPVDHLVEERFEHFLKKEKIESIYYDTPLFLTNRSECLDYAKDKKKLLQTSFYIYQRKKLGLWITKDGKPISGKWTYDIENRKKIPKNQDIPSIDFNEYINKKDDKIIHESKEYILETFPKKYQLGDIENPELIFPISIDNTKLFFNDFLKYRFNYFGMYQDAILSNQSSQFKKNVNPILFHSGISCLMNIGFLTPSYVVQKTLEFYEKHKQKIKFSTIEGFIRQIIGWREHCRLTYETKYNIMKSTNILNSSYILSESFYNGSTGILPLDESIKNGFKFGYLHHILRLMVMGSFMLMAEVDPNYAMKWFYEMSCDSYEWNMINNVKCMAMWADKGEIYTTKPYIASSNYILKMSNYKKDGKWDILWDSLYWCFINKHKNLIKKNVRLAGIQLNLLKKKKKDEMNKYHIIKREFQKKFLK